MNKNIPSQQPSGSTGNSVENSFDSGWREQLIGIVLRIGCVLGIGFLLLSFPSAANRERIIFASFYILLVAITFSRIPNVVRSAGLLFIMFAIGTYSLLTFGPSRDGSIFFILVVILSALLFDQRVDIILLLLSVLTFALIAILQQSGSYEPNLSVNTFTDWAAYMADFLLVCLVLLFAIGRFKAGLSQSFRDIQATNESLATDHAELTDKIRRQAEELEVRKVQLRSSAAVARTISEIHNVAELVDATTKLTTDQFGYYHVGLYLLDERKRIAFLQASSSLAGKELIGQGFRVEPNRLNLFSQVLEQKRPRIMLDVEANFIPDTNFPLTHSRLMLPLTVRGNVIGLIDIHSEEKQAFNLQDAEVLQSLADLVAISMENVSLIQEVNSLAIQVEETASMQTREIWTKFTSRNKQAYQYTPAGVRPLFAKNKIENTDGLHVPLTLHGQAIGGIVLKRKGIDAIWSERERALVEKVADQVALALENSRLVDETQKNAMRNQVIANISARIRETLDVESVIRTATTELRRVFDLKEAEISIGTTQTGAPPVKKHTSSLRLK